MARHIEMNRRNAMLYMNANSINHINVWFKFKSKQSTFSPTVVNAVDQKS